MSAKKPQMTHQILMLKNWILVFYILLIFVNSSCKTSKCVLCELDNKTIYNIELKEGHETKDGKTQLQTYFDLIPFEEKGGKVALNIVDCSQGEPYRLHSGEEMAKYVRENIFSVDSLDIKRITKTSDADIYPVSYTVQRLIEENKDLQFCQRSRNALKLELRGMLGARSLNTIYYSPVPGAEPDSNKFIGFGEEGTKLIMGPEIALLAPIYTINNKSRFHLGLLSGYWPVDGGNFIPISIHPRFTYNDITSPLFGICNAWYLFGDMGTAYDVSDKFSKFWDGNWFVSSFYGIGFGVDLWKTKKMDVSYDMGYRRTTLALPNKSVESQEFLDCLRDNGIDFLAYNKRKAGEFFIRIGLTF